MLNLIQYQHDRPGIFLQGDPDFRQDNGLNT
ncbi:hypothetical protein HNR62_002190 [Oceanisphaera litoralis]|nr:hypothetical protein [Oceanisphaera litoralis]